MNAAVAHHPYSVANSRDEKRRTIRWEQAKTTKNKQKKIFKKYHFFKITIENKNLSRNITKNKVPKQAKKQATPEHTAKAPENKRFSLVSRDIGNTASLPLSGAGWEGAQYWL